MVFKVAKKNKRQAAWKRWKKVDNVKKQSEKAELREYLKTRQLIQKMIQKNTEVKDGS